MAGKGNNPNYFIAGVVAVALFLGIYLFVTWERPSYEQADLIGTWHYDTSDLNISSQDGGFRSVSPVFYEFTSEGQWILTNSATGAASTGAYEIEGKTLTFHFDSGAQPESFAFFVKGDNLTLGEKDDKVVFKRRR